MPAATRLPVAKACVATATVVGIAGWTDEHKSVVAGKTAARLLVIGAYTRPSAI